jgi:hypothetical protein
VIRFRPALVEGIADRTTIETSRKLLSALAKKDCLLGLARERLLRQPSAS